MGTNYYAQDPCDRPCAHCTPLSLHICKSLTHFQGHHDTPYGTISSWADWKRVLQHDGLIVVDEYGGSMPVGEFIEAVENTSVRERRSQYDFMQNDFASTTTGFMFPEVAKEYWLDADQFTFTYRDFE